MKEISESEKKRQESLKRQKQIFRVKELAVKNALKNLDNKTNKNKIVFDEDIDQVEQSKIKKKTEKKKYDLFDNDEDNDELSWDADKVKIKKNVAGKPYGHSVTLGNDERFKIDKRFMEDAHLSEENIATKNSDAVDLQKEKERQLDILENILGVPIASKNRKINKDLKFAKKEMIRYDPTQNNHKEYEIVAEKSEEKTEKIKTKRKDKDILEGATDHHPNVEVTKDVYFSVSESLSKSLKEGAQFSLLKAYGKVENTEKGNNDYNVINTKSVKHKKFQFNDGKKNPFKYDSSDDESDNKKTHVQNEQNKNAIVKDTNNFFFDTNDTRFNEAVNFFSKEFVSDNEFKTLRQELKEIVRLKIRRNMKKNQPWGRRKKIKRLS